jgi:predicted ester cyclase
MAHDIKTVVSNAFHVLNQNDLKAFGKTLSPKFQAAFADAAARARAAFPDMQLTVNDVISEGNKVVTRWTMTGTHKGVAREPLLGEVKPTGKHVTVQGITISQIENGVIVETWGATSELGALVQLGLVGHYAKAVGQHP